MVHISRIPDVSDQRFKAAVFDLFQVKQAHPYSIFYQLRRYLVPQHPGPADNKALVNPVIIDFQLTARIIKVYVRLRFQNDTLIAFSGQAPTHLMQSSFRHLNTIYRPHHVLCSNRTLSFSIYTETVLHEMLF
jgi:hypothetical protein